MSSALPISRAPFFPSTVFDAPATDTPAGVLLSTPMKTTIPFSADPTNNVYGNWPNGAPMSISLIPSTSIQQQQQNESIPFHLHFDQSPIFDLTRTNSYLCPSSTANSNASFIYFYNCFKILKSIVSQLFTIIINNYPLLN